MFLIKKYLLSLKTYFLNYYHFLQENYVRKLCMVIFLLSFVKGSKSAEGGKNPLADMDPGGKNPLADMDRGGPYPLADLDRGVQF